MMREWRAAGWTHAELAFLFEMSQTAVSKACRGLSYKNSGPHRDRAYLQEELMKLWEWINDLSYKPGWKFTLNYRSTGRHSMWVTAKVQHSTTLEWVTFDFERMIPKSVYDDLDGFLQWVEDITLEAEFHELREFLRFKGHLVNDPHDFKPASDGKIVKSDGEIIKQSRFMGVQVPDSPGHSFIAAPCGGGMRDR